MPLLCGILDADEEIAILRGDGPGRWIAQRQVPVLPDGKYALWHIPSGPLPLLHRKGGDGLIENPWAGWREEMPGAEPSTSYFGAGHPRIFSLELYRTPLGKGGYYDAVGEDEKRWRVPAAQVIGMSCFGWIGNRYRDIGNGSEATTEKAWKSLRSRVSKFAKKIPRWGPCDGAKGEIWAFPDALAKIGAGTPRAHNPGSAPG